MFNVPEVDLFAVLGEGGQPIPSGAEDYTLSPVRRQFGTTGYIPKDQELDRFVA